MEILKLITRGKAVVSISSAMYKQLFEQAIVTHNFRVCIYLDFLMNST